MDGHLVILYKVKQLILSFHTLLIAMFHVGTFLKIGHMYCFGTNQGTLIMQHSWQGVVSCLCVILFL